MTTLTIYTKRTTEAEWQLFGKFTEHGWAQFQDTPVWQAHCGDGLYVRTVATREEHVIPT